VFDGGAAGDAAQGLAELGVEAPVHRVLDVEVGLADALIARLADEFPVAVVVYSDDAGSLAAGLAATRVGALVIRVGRSTEAPCPFIARAERAGRSPVRRQRRVRHRQMPRGREPPDRWSAPPQAHGRHARGWRDHGVTPLLVERPARARSARLAELARSAQLIVASAQEPDDALRRSRAAVVAMPGFVERLSLLREAGVIVTDSPRVQEEATALGNPCWTLDEPRGRVRADAGGTAEWLGRDHRALAHVRPGPHHPTPRAIPLWDGGAGERLADVLVANLARVQIA
jgi:hypothetical protein